MTEIAARMSKLGLRDLSTVRHPEASIAQAMSRDVVFRRVATLTFALQSVITHHRKLLASSKTPQPKETLPSPGGTCAAEPCAQPDTTNVATPVGNTGEPPAEDDADYISDDDDEDGVGGTGRQSQAEPWLQALLTQDYDLLSLADRLAALTFLINLVTNGPTVRAKLDERSEVASKLKKSLLEKEVKVKGILCIQTTVLFILIDLIIY